MLCQCATNRHNTNKNRTKKWGCVYSVSMLQNIEFKMHKLMKPFIEVGHGKFWSRRELRGKRVRFEKVG